MPSHTACTRLRPIRHLSSIRTSTPPLRSHRRRTYYSYETPQAAPYPPLETQILSSALSHVPQSGFSMTSLRAGCRSVNYIESTTNLFPRSVFEMIVFHLATQRLALSDRKLRIEGFETRRVGARVKALILARLEANVQAGTVGDWKTALGYMSLAGNIPASLRELGLLADEMWFLAGDVSVDTSWYTKRASLAGVYAATETFQSVDQSTGFKDTEEFLDRRLEDVRVLGSSWRNVTEWAGFQGVAAVNLARNLGLRI